MKNPLLVLVVLLFTGAIINHYVYEFSMKEGQLEQLRHAHQNYKKGETSLTVGGREDGFNRSLENYLDLEKKYHPAYGNGKLFFNIANSFFQLGNYPFAVLYYYRAEKLMPRSEVVKRNLDTALSKLGIKRDRKPSVIERIFFFHYFLSIPEQLQLTFLSFLAAFALGSTYIWTRVSWLKSFGTMAAFAGLVFLISFGYTYYLSPIDGVIVQSIGLYRDAGLQYAKVREKPILSGNQVEVLDVVGKGKWLKVRTSEGEVGYIPQESIRII